MAVLMALTGACAALVHDSVHRLAYNDVPMALIAAEGDRVRKRRPVVRERGYYDHGRFWRDYDNISSSQYLTAFQLTRDEVAGMLPFVEWRGNTPWTGPGHTPCLIVAKAPSRGGPTAA